MTGGIAETTGSKPEAAIGDAPAGDAGAPGQARLSCVGVTVRFGGLVAVNNVDLSVPPATIVGLVGPNGAGKSTLFGVLSGLLRPSQGTVLLDGEDVTNARPQVRAARGLARTFQHPELFISLTIRDHLVLAHRAKHAKGRIWSDLFTMGSLRRPRPAETEIVDELLELLGLKDVADHSAMGLPLGVARMVELGRALAASPTVLLLDEPSSGLDSSETEQFETVMRRITAERGIAALLVEHDVDLVMRLSSAVYVLEFGTLIASGSPEDVRKDPAVRAAYLGEEVSEAEASAEAKTVEEELSEAKAPEAAAPEAAALEAAGTEAAAAPQADASAEEPSAAEAPEAAVSEAAAPEAAVSEAAVSEAAVSEAAVSEAAAPEAEAPAEEPSTAEASEATAPEAAPEAEAPEAAAPEAAVSEEKPEPDAAAAEAALNLAAAEKLAPTVAVVGSDGASLGDGAGFLTVENLSVRYGEAMALTGVSFTLGAGKALAVLGANGAGKSSLARALSGLVTPHGGQIVFADQDISSWRPHRIRRASLVYLPEGRGVFRGLTVLDNLKLAAATVPGRQARRQAIELALEIFPALASRRHQLAGLLSGGEQQMLSLARALATSPKLVIADEMSLGLAPKMVDLVFDGLARARESGITVIMIEQYVHRALDFADECLVLQRGAVAWQGSANTARGEVLRHYLGDAMTVEV
ncbi:MAG: ATP-binding cassette domain-containing protein [Frankia sp.]